MACKNVCKLCNHLVLSTAIAFTGGNLVVTIPEGSYNNGEKYCIVLAQSIPNATTITAPVMIQIGTGTTLYPLENRCCAQVTACGVRTRTKYATRVATSATGGAFKMLGNPACSRNNNLTAINGTAPAADAPSGPGTEAASPQTPGRHGTAPAPVPTVPPGPGWAALP